MIWVVAAAAFGFGFLVGVAALAVLGASSAIDDYRHGYIDAMRRISMGDVE